MLRITPTALLVLGLTIGWLAAAQAPRGEDAAQESKPEERFELRLARLKLQLAEANLRRVRQANERVRGVTPANVVREYEADHDIARGELKLAEEGGDTLYAAYLRRAEATATAAQSRWRSAQAANQRAAGTFGELDLERLRLRAAVAQTLAEEGRRLFRAPAEDRLAWQLRLVREEVDRLNEAAIRTPPTGRVIVPWLDYYY